MTERLSTGTFEPRVGEEFAVATPEGPVALRLVTVVPHEQYVRSDDGWVPFSLMFSGPADAPLDQRTHRLANAATGELDVFLVPVARDADGYRYEAVFG